MVRIIEGDTSWVRYRVKIYKNDPIIAVRREVKRGGKWTVVYPYTNFNKLLFPAVARLMAEE